MSTIDVLKLNFEYPGKLALEDVSFSIEPESITALVGPNGAGKTTLMNCMAALARPISGKITVDGMDVLSDPRKYHQMIGYLPDSFGLYEDLTVRQCLKYIGLAHNINNGKILHSISETADLVHMTDILDKKVKSLSRGMKQRVAIGQAIIHNPEFLLLDEPATGLDPEARYDLSRLLLKLCRDGKTIVVSSHILSELEDYATHLLVIRNGRLQEHTRLSNIKSGVKRKLALTLAEPLEGVVDRLKEFDLIEEIQGEGTCFQFSFKGDLQDQRHLLKTIMDQGIPVCSLGEIETDLQEIYVNKYRDQSIGGKK